MDPLLIPKPPLKKLNGVNLNQLNEVSVSHPKERITSLELNPAEELISGCKPPPATCAIWGCFFFPTNGKLCFPTVFPQARDTTITPGHRDVLRLGVFPFRILTLPAELVRTASPPPHSWSRSQRNQSLAIWWEHSA